MVSVIIQDPNLKPILKKEFDINAYLYDRSSKSSIAELNQFKWSVEETSIKL